MIIKVNRKTAHRIPNTYDAISSNTASKYSGWLPRLIIQEAEELGIDLYLAGSLRGRGSLFAPKTLIEQMVFHRG